MKKILMMCVAGMMAGVAFGATETIDGMTYEYTISGGNATITKATGDNKNVVIPSTLGGATVTTLKGGVFKNNTTMMKVTIPETVTTMTSVYDSGVGNYLGPFFGCIALTSCNIPSGVTAIPSCCFYGCTKLRAVTLPKGLKSIESAAFHRCTSLYAIDLPEGLTSIDYSAFEYCSSLTHVIIPDNVTSVGGCCFRGCSSLVLAHIPSGLRSIPAGLFDSCSVLKDVNIPESVTAIGYGAFSCCYSLKDITLPAGVMSLEPDAFSGVGRVIFQGKPPTGLADNTGISQIVYPREYGAQYRVYFPVSKTGGYTNPNKPIVTIVSSGVRKNNPTVLDVVYKVTSTKPTVKVRALAFEDGLRSFAKVTRPETFIEGTAANIGDAITANEEHTLSWQVSTDFKTDLAKMRFEVLAMSEDLLPLELMTIPANGTNKAMEMSWNLLTQDQFFDALMWLYAAKTEGLTLENGVLKNGTTLLANGSQLYCESGRFEFPAVSYVFSRMGYGMLSDDALTYANAMTRLGLKTGVETLDPSNRYAYKWIEE